jgi:NADH-quinone oxidoreductase subunit M
MIAHGFVVVGLFFIADIIYRRYETRTIEMGGIRTQAKPLRCFNTGIGLSCITNYFNFVRIYRIV